MGSFGSVAAERGRGDLRHFKAPWDARVRLVTILAVLLAAALWIWQDTWSGVAAAAIVMAAAAFAPRGYTVGDGQLLIHRLGWSKKLDLHCLEKVEWQPGITMGSVRTMANGGLFGYVGHFRNEMLGWYRAYATDSARAVVLYFGKDKILVTPDDPAFFVEEVRAAARRADW